MFKSTRKQGYQSYFWDTHRCETVSKLDPLLFYLLRHVHKKDSMLYEYNVIVLSYWISLHEFYVYIYMKHFQLSIE